MKDEQLKLLNFYKSMSAIATNLVGAFIPLIVYKYTGSLVLAVLYMVGVYIVRFLTTLVFRKLMFKYAQLFILLRFLPIILYSIFLFLLDVNVILAVIGTGIFVGVSDSFSSLPNEIVHNYSSLNKGSSSVGITVFFEKIGVIAAFVAGGLFLDYLAQWILVLASLILYLISVIPLAVYFIKNRNSKGFNNEAVSNAVITFSENPDKSQRGKKLSRKMMIEYGFAYFLYNVSTPVITFFSLYLFIKNGEFAIVGYLTAAYNAAVMITSLFAGKLDQKKDLTVFVWLGFLIFGITKASLILTNFVWLWFISFVIMGLIEGIVNVFVLERMRSKTRILGVSNEALFSRYKGQCLGSVTTSLFFIATAPLFLPVFIFLSVADVIAGTYIVTHEEKARKTLVRYLQGDDE